MANILFVHNNFPGQFRWIAQSLIKRGHRCAAIGSETAQPVGNMAICRWKAARGSTPNILDFATRAEADMIRGSAAAQCALEYQKKGFTPDLIIGHPGWGETVFLNEVFPNAKVILHGEYYYRSKGGDVDFDLEFGKLAIEGAFRVHAKNATMALTYAEAARIVCPTPFQAGTFPRTFKPNIRVIHEGIDTEQVKRVPDARFELADGTVLTADMPVITLVNRNLEPCRGFHSFMRALPEFQKRVPNGRALIIGSDDRKGYGRPPADGRTWREVLMAEVGDKIDASRVHFAGRVSYDRLLAAFSLTRAHVYLTYPFVLSWSMLEAMACEALVIGSDTGPVRDAIQPGRNGLIVDFFDTAGLAARMAEACETPEKFTAMRRAARLTVVERYDLHRVCLPAWMKLVEQVLAEKA